MTGIFFPTISLPVMIKVLLTLIFRHPGCAAMQEELTQYRNGCCGDVFVLTSSISIFFPEIGDFTTGHVAPPCLLLRSLFHRIGLNVGATIMATPGEMRFISSTTSDLFLQDLC